MPSIREDTGRDGGFEAGPGCGLTPVLIVAVLLILLVILVREGVIPP